MMQQSLSSTSHQKNKHDDPNYGIYNEWLREKSNDELIDRIIQRLNLMDDKRKGDQKANDDTRE